jgi:hypothetical protein
MRLEGAGFVIDNNGDLAHLAAQLDDAWEWMRSTPDAVPEDQGPWVDERMRNEAAGQAAAAGDDD